MTISCQTWGREWGTDGFGDELDELAGLGINWVAIHPYAGVRKDGSLSWRPIDPDAPPDWLARPIAAAQSRGIAILIKPHLAYWGSGFRWRGDVEFPDPAALVRFFENYERWIVEVARATRGADAFAVGTELDRLIGEEQRWRQVVSKVRAATPARLTYAANWDAFERVPFWDALDAVGVQAYFPLCEKNPPDADSLRAGWELVLPRLRDVADRSGKPLIFTEIGYDLSLEAAREPWNPVRPHSKDEVRARETQALCLEVALDVMAQERDWLRGAFLWKWFVGESRGEDFLVDSPHLRDLLGRRWGGR